MVEPEKVTRKAVARDEKKSENDQGKSSENKVASTKQLHHSIEVEKVERESVLPKVY